MADPVSHASLAARLRECSEAATHYGRLHDWRPRPGSDADDRWHSLPESLDALQLTLTEAEAHAGLLVRSGLEHSSALATSIAKRQAYVPHALARTAQEHLLRAFHHLDLAAPPQERAVRRLDEWLYALSESGYRRMGVVKAGHPGADQVPDESAMLDRIKERAHALGIELKRARGSYRASERGRASTMQLAEQHLNAGGGDGVPAFMTRNLAAVTHGVETGLLASADERVVAEAATSFSPKILDPPTLAYALLPVPLVLVNAVGELARTFDWEQQSRQWASYDRATQKMLDAWQRAVALYLDDIAPERKRTGILGPRP